MNGSRTLWCRPPTVKANLHKRCTWLRMLFIEQTPLWYAPDHLAFGIGQPRMISLRPERKQSSQRT
jgi:hypothetical protein